MYDLTHIRIVLVQTSHPGNIGAAARAMKTMGLRQLYLVAPRHFPSETAVELASRADDILQQAQVVDTLAQAVSDCQWVLGASVRTRGVVLPMWTPQQAADNILQQAQPMPMAIVFGCEKTGLTNEQLHQCHYQIQIPANPHYSSLNLAQAVQVICYQLRASAQVLQQPEQTALQPLASHSQLQGFYQHLERVLEQLQFLHPTQDTPLMMRLRRLFNRAQLEPVEVNILRGILTAIERQRSKES
ncbi:MAG: TrmJ/YjtD family RNA methyltransferase [Legionellales bacterium]|nr:TrmJ/YjtD family RNA methyltransferase [Legionellales bacterium]